MKTAIEKLKELRQSDSSIVAIAKDWDCNVFYYKNDIPEEHEMLWNNFGDLGEGYFPINEEIKFENSNWSKCIVTYKDLEEFEVEMMAISKADYDRLLACEKKLENILNIISK